jgi:hypothetical protein
MMTIEKFQQLYSVSLMDATDLEKSSLYVQIMTGYSAEKVDAMSMKSFEKVCSKVAKSFESLSVKMIKSKPRSYVRANGRLYHLTHDVLKMDAGKYVEAATFSEDIIMNLHKIMATMATPIKLGWKGVVKTERDHEFIALDMLKLEFDVAYQSAVFFCKLFDSLIKSLQPFLNSQEVEQVDQQRKDFLQRLDGFTMPNWYLNSRL